MTPAGAPGPSLRLRLAIAVVGVLAGVLLAFSLALHALFARALWRQFDGRLAGDAAAVAGMVEEETAVPWEFEYVSLPEFERGPRPAYFQVWLDDGSVFARSPSLGGLDLPAAPDAAARIDDLTLPDGRRGRGIHVRLPARSERRDEPPPGGTAPPHRLVAVAVARGTEEVSGTLGTMRAWLWALTALVLAGASAAALIAVSRGLGPARALADEIARLDEANLARPLSSLAGLPRELEPVARKLDDLLARLAASFARERSFTADVSHELRTPLAALRTTLEVARSKPRPAPGYEQAIDDALLVVGHMHRLVDDLLTLARLDARQVDVRTAELPLRELVADCWRPVEPRARERRLAFTNEIAAGATVASDPDKLRLVVTNLLTNAADYTASGGEIVVRGGAGATLIEVRDSGPRIADELLPRIFDRFARADASRSGGLHCGIGLALVKSVCQLLDLAATAENEAGGGVCFRIARRPG